MTVTANAPSIEHATDESQSDAILQVRDLTTEFPTRNGPLRAVNNISVDVPRARALAIIGESGSGKSALMKTILGLQPPHAKVTGQVLLNGRDLLALTR